MTAKKPRPPGRPGRPRRSKEPADIRVTIRLTNAEHAAWLKRAGAMPLGEWLRRLVSNRTTIGELRRALAEALDLAWLGENQFGAEQAKRVKELLDLVDREGEFPRVS